MVVVDVVLMDRAGGRLVPDGGKRLVTHLLVVVLVWR